MKCPRTVVAELTLSSAEWVTEFTICSNQENHRQTGQILHPWANQVLREQQEDGAEETPEEHGRSEEVIKHSEVLGLELGLFHAFFHSVLTTIPGHKEYH